MATLKLTAVGTSTGVAIPKEMLARLNVRKGDVLHAIETAFAEKMRKAEQIMRRYDEEAATQAVMALADGSLDDAGFAAFPRENITSGMRDAG